MSFAEELNKLINELGITQSQFNKLTGIAKSSISQYLAGKNEPSEERKKKIALALGVQEDYFQKNEDFMIQCNSCVNLPVTVAAKLMGKSKEWIMQGLRDGVFPWGYAVKMTKWSYFISSVKFQEYTGISIIHDKSA